MTADAEHRAWTAVGRRGFEEMARAWVQERAAPDYPVIRID
jgi:hypothetical protein